MLAVDIILALQVITGLKNKTHLGRVVYEMDFKKITGLQPLLAFVKEKIDANATYRDVEGALAQVRKIKDDARLNNIHILAPDDIRFPPSLKVIVSPPMLLFAKGDLSALTCELAVAVVGTREASPFGIEMAQNIARQLALHNISVVSGLALGCDAAAHQGCLERQGRTIAVLAHGLKMIYPYQNRFLAAEIIRNGGCLLSEYMPDIKPTKYFFVERDRLQSGLSQGVIIIESTINGGTMHTARFAQQQGKKVACVKHPSDFLASYPDYKCNVEGNTLLLNQGATQLGLDVLPDFIAQLGRLKIEGTHESEVPEVFDDVGTEVPPQKKICTSRFFHDGTEQSTSDAFLRISTE